MNRFWPVPPILSGRSARWLIIAPALGMAFTLVAVYAIWLAAGAISLESRLDNFESEYSASRLATDRDASEAAAVELDSILADIDSLDSRFGPVRIAAAVIGWFPVIGGNVRAGPLLVDRSRMDAEAAQELAGAANVLLDVYAGIAARTDGPAELARDGQLRDSISLSAGRLQDAGDALDQARDVETRLARYWLFGPVGSAADKMTRSETRLRSYVDWASVTVNTVSASLVMLETATSAEADLSSLGSMNSAGLAEMLPLLAVLSEQSGEAYSWASESVRLAPEGIADSDMARLMTEMEASTGAVHKLISGVDLALRSVSPALERISEADGPLLKNGDLLEAVRDIESHQHELADAAMLLSEGADLLAMAPESGPLAPPGDIRQAMDEHLHDLQRGIGFLLAVPLVAPFVLGENEKRTFLVLGQTSDELRPAGGFTSSVWRLTFEHGSLQALDYLNVVEVDDTGNLGIYPPPPEALRIHMNAGAWYMRDVGWDPHFPSVARNAIDLYRLGMDEEVDGVIAVTQWAFVTLAEALGEIETADGPVAASEVMDVIEDGTDAEGTGYLGVLFEGLIDSLGGEAMRDNGLGVASAMNDVVSAKDVMMFVTDPVTQAEIHTLGWDGAMPKDGHDRLAIMDSNVGWTKSDRNIERSAHYSLHLAENGVSEAALTLRYDNLSGENSRTCERQSNENASVPYVDLTNACYWNLLRAYTAAGSRLIDSDPMRLPANSIAHRVGYMAPGDSTFESTFDLNGNYFSGLISIAAGESRTVTTTYEVPASVVDWTSESPTYRLDLVAQSGSRGRNMSIELHLPPGYAFESANLTPVTVTSSSVTFELDLRRDITLEVEMTPDGEGQDRVMHCCS
ncbi:MAG: DUF4012 domain-containing protein [Dehalococcoidia bacterium]